MEEMSLKALGDMACKKQHDAEGMRISTILQMYKSAWVFGEGVLALDRQSITVTRSSVHLSIR